MEQYLVCRGCLAVHEESQYVLSTKTEESYESLLGIPLTPLNGFPEYLCVFCHRTLHRFAAFKARCLQVVDVLLSAQTQGGLITKDYVQSLSSHHPELSHRFGETKTLTLDINSETIQVFKHEPKDMSKILFKIDKVEPSDEYIVLEDDILDEELLKDDLLEVKHRTHEVYIKDLKPANRRIKHSKPKNPLRSGKKKKVARSDSQIVTEYALSAGFDVRFLSHAEQVREVEEKKSVNSTFNCKLCGKPFRDPEALRRHTKKYHVLKPDSFMCDICSCVFATKRGIRVHVTGHSWVFTCKTCGFKTKQRPVLRRHQFYHIGKTFQCQYCDRVFDKHATYFSHVRFLHANMLPFCEYCGEFFNSAKGVDAHMKMSHDVLEEFPIVCPSCDGRFESVTALDRHVKVKGCGGANCPRCGDTFPGAPQLKRHAVHAHAAGGRAARAHGLFTCCECSKPFTNAMYLKRHYAAAHSGRQPAPRGRPARSLDKTKYKLPTQLPTRKWSLVGSGDVTIGILEDVKEKQTDEHTPNRVMCEVCGKYVKTPSELKYHQQTHHSSVNNFVCSHCDKGFKRKDLLQSHERVHTGERPYPCEQCGKAFKTYAARRRHLLVHTGERRHVCSLCNKRFQLSSSVKWHIKTAHLNLPWPQRKKERKKKDATKSFE